MSSEQSPGNVSSGGQINAPKAWRPPKEMMILCPLFMAMQFIMPLLVLRRLSRIERRLGALQEAIERGGDVDRA
jgi:hypothetical protein